MIHHHPSNALLAAFSAGTLDLGQHVAVATHLVSCASCGDFVHAMEHVGGSFLADLPPTQMSRGAFAATVAELKAPSALQKVVPPVAAQHESPVNGLPAFMKTFPIGPWKWLAPKMALARIALPERGDTRVFLLKAGPGTRLIQHTHTDLEITCVLKGSFHHQGGRYSAGDFDFGDTTMTHDVFIDEGEDCICLIAMQGELQLKGMIGRLLQPFVRM